MGSFPEYRYVTGSMNIKYLKPTPNLEPVKLVAKLKLIKGKKTVLTVEVYSGETLTAEAEVIAIRFYDSSDIKRKGFL